MKALILISALVSSSAFAAQLGFTFKNKSAILINANTSSCQEVIQSASSGRSPSRDIQANYFQLLSPVLAFQGAADEQALIFNIHVEMKDPSLQSGSYKCDVSGDELSALFSSGVMPWNGILDSTMPIAAANPACLAMKCGNVMLSGTSASMNATVRVDGVVITADGDQLPIRATSNLKIDSIAK